MRDSMANIGKIPGFCKASAGNRIFEYGTLSTGVVFPLFLKSRRNGYKYIDNPRGLPGGGWSARILFYAALLPVLTGRRVRRSDDGAQAWGAG